MAVIIGVFEQGFIYAIMALGVYITYKILDFPDLTVDGSFPLGAAVGATLITKGINPYLTLPICFLIGAAAGVLTGLIHVKLKVRDLLSGIIMMTALYTINLRIAGKANVPLFNVPTIFSNGFLDNVVPEWLVPYETLIVIVIVALISKLLLDLYMKTKSGFLLRAVGDNPTLVTALAKDSGLVKIVGLSIANGLVALGGCVMAQQQRYFDISMGTGTIVIGLASVIIGSSLMKGMSFLKATTAVIIGSILYKACVMVAIREFEAIDMKLITAVLFLVILVISRKLSKKKVKTNAGA